MMILSSPSYWDWFGGGLDRVGWDPPAGGSERFYTAQDILARAQDRTVRGNLPVSVNRPVLVPVPGGYTVSPTATVNDNGQVVGTYSAPVANSSSMLPLLALGALALLLLKR